MGELRTFRDLASLSVAAANEVESLANASVRARGVFHLALSGGSTPKRMFEVLAARGRAALPWASTHLWWSDERAVGPEHADSNYRMAREAMIDVLGLDPARVHRLRGEADPATAAAEYEAALIQALGEPPVLDVILLGMGPDGHTASLFPGSPALADTTHWVVANPIDSPLAHGKATRLTVTPRTIAAARYVRVLVAGADKAPALHEVLMGPRHPYAYPAQLIEGYDVVWFVDDAAASELD